MECEQKRTRKHITKSAHNKYFGVAKCDNTIRTIVGNEKFVRRRLAELCTLHHAEQVFCQARADGDKDRQMLANLLTSAFNSKVIVYEKNRKFEFLNLNEIVDGKQIVLEYFKNESHSKINAN